MDVANQIYRYLGGNKFVVMTGAKNIVGDGNTLRMTLPKNGSKANRLWVTYDESLDLFNMRFFKYRPGKIDIKTGRYIEDKISDVAEYSGLFFDQLQGVFTQHTKMYTHL